MPLQTENLVMVGLGIKDDAAPNPQPKLPGGVHLRWSFEQELGFPWYGFYLFRRPTQIANPICLSAATDSFQKGKWPDKVLNTVNGHLRSDANLVLTDDFFPSGRVEFDLENRGHLRFELPSNEPASRVDVQIGFRQIPVLARTQVPCVNFTDLPAGTGPNPRTELGVQFEVRRGPGLARPTTSIDVLTFPSGVQMKGLNCLVQLDITLPAPCSFVELTLSHNSSPPRFEAFNADGSSAGSIQMQTPKNQPETARINGTAITRVVVFAPNLEVWLHNFCFAFFAFNVGPVSKIQVTALFEDTQVAGTTVSGQPGQVVSASFEADAITAIEISPGPAALVDVCFSPVSQDATRGWELVPGFPYPMCLPVTHPDYPCSGGKPVNLAAAEALALGRVRYGPAANWGGQNFANLHDTLLELVVGGPAGIPMAARSKSVQAESSPTDGIAGPPTMPGQHPLDLVLLSALHPPFAQMLGLYWVDTSADLNNRSYDYLIVADYKGVGGRNLKKILSIIASSGFDQLEGYIVFNKRIAPAPSLPAPGDVRAYALPGGTFPKTDGTLPDAQNNAGLRWELGVTDSGVLQPDKPIMYHVWRAELGDATNPALGGTHKLITENMPVLVTEPRLPLGATSQRAADWPPFPLHFIDRFLADGWYSYQVSGIDLFGRYSSNSNAATWYEWKPMPEPRPWYYRDPPGDTPIHQSAVRLRDTTPPPPPTGIEAHALDPADPTVVKDKTYETWHDSLSNEEQTQLIGLRVKWLWTAAHQRQAPDAREFRIYFNPGPDLPAPDRSEAINWQERYYVVNYDDPIAFKGEDLDGTRFYDILLPDAADKFRDGLALVPSLAEPVIYAHIGVSAADDKTHTVDSPKWSAGLWGDRFGNEGRVGPPVKIYRVLRTPPEPPAVPPDAEKVFATRADYYSRSFYTYRWRPVALLKAHIFRAMDDTVFKTDWSARPRPALAGSQLALFPDETIEPRWSAAKRQQVADELNQLNGFAHNEQGTAEALAYYRGLSNDALRILPGLPDNDRAFSQLTIDPLDPDDPANANRRGPDNDDSFIVDPALRIYEDNPDGRASNRYFYRAVYVDGAHNRSQFSLSGPPVYLPKVVPPRPPVITKVLGGDRQITIKWASNREPDLAEYRVYRTEGEEAARDLRLMTLVSIQVVEAPPESRPAEAEWADSPVPGLMTFYYRLVAVDDAGNVSAPSAVAAGRAFDDLRPDPPTWNPPAVGTTPDEIVLSWSSAISDLQCLVQRRLADTTFWENISNWLPRGAYSFSDNDRIRQISYAYRLRVMDNTGRTNNTYNELTVTGE